MNNELASAMRRATELVRAGDPAAATKLIQTAVGGTGSQGVKGRTPVSVPQTEQRSRLRETIAKLATKMPSQGMSLSNAAEPSLPDGAAFDSGTFTCAAGSREYRIYVPNLKNEQPAGIIMMLHGCTQSPVDFANGTGMNRLADAHGLIVVYPAQSRGANMQSCWNWFGPADQNRGAGEPAILAGLAEKLARDHDVPTGKIYAAGLSAGAAMAVILGQTYPDVFAAIGAHSGLPYKSAHDVPSAFKAMGETCASSMSAQDPSVPTIVFHGGADSTVNAVNGQRIADDACQSGAAVMDGGAENGRRYTRATVRSNDGQAVMEHWRIEGLGHAWSGGDAGSSYTDPKGPDASAEMVRFFLNLSVKGN